MGSNGFYGIDYKNAVETGINLSNNPKNKFAMIANAIVSLGKCSNINRSEEFLKDSIFVK